MRDLLREHLQNCSHLVTLENHQRMGGFGSAVLEASNRLTATMAHPTARIKVLGMPDRFLEHRTTVDEQLAEAGLDVERVARTVRTLLGEARRGQ